ncbi:hypothetical protein [Pseudomonas japonica]|uniref:Uncharacterized protein n=1 Tax=Pseudomonas japonica TaxID=256466 RepID=A0A239GSA7_9PSED|nr:hypothetical protein [Pseudomonas japonica]SNS71765.1 hypothetical protein SAMN05444352_113128 [Pseudomonas japonica]
MSEFPEPHIPLLRDDDTIDLGQVGASPLLTYVKYPGIAMGDTIHLNWRGCSPAKRVVDALGLSVVVSEDGGYDETLGMRVQIPNSLLSGVDQGWAFYSYVIERGAQFEPESLRQFIQVGIRPLPRVHLPVVQLREAHGLLLNPQAMGPLGVTAVAAPYLAMQVGDRVTLHWRGYFDDELDNQHNVVKTLAAGDIGKPLQWVVPSIHVLLAEGGEAHLHYSVQYREGGQVSQSGQQVFRVARENGVLLPSLRIDGHDGGEQLDPGLFPNGLVLRIDLYPDIRVGDEILLYWLGNRESFSTVKSLRVDTSTLDSGVLLAHLEPQWLEAAQGERISLFHQFARGGAAASSLPLALQIRRPLNLLPPIVDDASAEGGNGENKGVLAAGDAVFGAQVNVPETVPIGSQDRLEVHWQGHPEGGRHIATTPISEQQNRSFFIPPSAIAANMSAGESKRFPVFYRLTPAGEAPQDSVPFNLRIAPLPSGVYPNVQCLEAQGNQSLSLRDVPVGGANLRLDGWLFIAVGQLLTLEAVGVAATGAESVVVRDAWPVSASEFAGNRVHALLPRWFLQRLLLNQQFFLKARVSFDKGESFTSFNDTAINLVA